MPWYSILPLSCSFSAFFTLFLASPILSSESSSSFSFSDFLSSFTGFSFFSSFSFLLCTLSNFLTCAALRSVSNNKHHKIIHVFDIRFFFFWHCSFCHEMGKLVFLTFKNVLYLLFCSSFCWFPENYRTYMYVYSAEELCWGRCRWYNNHVVLGIIRSTCIQSSRILKASPVIDQFHSNHINVTVVYEYT